MPQQSAATALDHVAAKKGLKRVPRVQSITKRRSAATIWTVSQLLEGFGDPRAILLEIAATPTDKLAKEIGCTQMEALGERRLCAQAVLPYVAQKLPIQVDMRHTKAIHLNIVTDDEYRDLAQLAQADDNHDSDLEAVQLIQGHVIEHTSTPPTTAAGLQPATDAHVHAEHTAEDAHEAQPSHAQPQPVGVEHRGLGTEEKEQH